MPSGYEQSPDYGGPEPPQWIGPALVVLLIAVIVLVGCFAVATQMGDTSLRETLGYIYFVGTYFVVAPAFVVICGVAIAVRLRRYFRSK